MKLRLDLHLHSTNSPDSFNTIETINRRIKEQGLDGYALADHDTINGLREAEEKKYDLAFIPALEVSAKGVHILALDPTDVVPEELSMAETVERIHEQGATGVLAHPYGLPKSWVRINEVREAGFDAIEVANSAQIPYDYICAKNKRLAEELELPITGGSDSHIPATIGRSYTIVEAESPSKDDVIKAIKLGRTSVDGTYTHITEWFSKNFLKKRRIMGF